MGKLKLRPEVARFAALMERTLRENDHKGGWKKCEPEWLLNRLGEEVQELVDAQQRLKWALPMEDRGDIPVFRKVLALGKEAADVANFAMMIADVCDALAKERP